MTNEELNEFLYEQIPLARALGVEVRRSDHTGAEVFAPLSNNINHMGTAFGGSLNAVLITSCYAWLFHHLEKQGLHSHVLIKEGNTQYLHPVKGDFRAICIAPVGGEYENFQDHFDRKGKARLALEAYIENEAGKACVFKGLFVAVKSKKSELG